MALVFLVRSGDHAREHREQRCPRSGGHGGRFPSTHGRRKRCITHRSGRGGSNHPDGGGRRGGGCSSGSVGDVGTRAVGRVAHFPHSHFLLPLFPPVFGPVQISMLVKHQADPGRVHTVGLPESRGRVQFLLGHLEQHGTVTERNGNAAHLWVL